MAAVRRLTPAPDDALTGSPRLAWYNPLLDPRTQATKMTPAMAEAAATGAYNDGTVARGGPLNPPDDDHPTNLVSSLCDDGLHRPALDVDVPMVVVPSSTPGHSHVYFPTLALPWPKYVALLSALAAAGIIDDAYLLASLGRGQTLLRPPGVAKGPAVRFGRCVDDTPEEERF